MVTKPEILSAQPKGQESARLSLQRKVIYDLANRFYKLAVELTIVNKQEITAYFQELSERTQDLYNYISSLVQARSITPESQSHADRLRVLTGGALNMLNQPEVDIDALVQQHQTIAGEFETLKNSYLHPLGINATTYEPMKEIQDGLAAVGSLLQQQQNQPTGQTTVGELT